MRIRVDDRGGLARLAKDLRAHGEGRAMRRELVQGIRAEARPAVNAARVAYKSMPSKQSKSGLRAALARAVTLEIRTTGKRAGVRIHVKGSKMPDGKGGLPRRIEGAPRWRHPVFGDRETWVSQPPRPTFYRALKRFEAPVGRAVLAVATRIQQRIAGGR
jgi:hypothetical protein